MQKQRVSPRRLSCTLGTVALTAAAPVWAQRFDSYDTSTTAGMAATFAGMTLVVTIWLTLAENGAWHRITVGHPWARVALVLGPPIFIGWLLS